MTRLIISGNGELSFALNGVCDGGSCAFDHLTLTLAGGGARADLTLDAPIRISQADLEAISRPEEADGRVRHLESFDAIVRNGAGVALARLRDELASLRLKMGAEGKFFGVEGEGWTAWAELRIPQLVPGGEGPLVFLAGARARLKGAFRLAQAEDAQLDLEADVDVEILVKLSGADLVAGLGLRTPDMSLFNLRLPEWPLQGLRLSDWTPDLSGLGFPLVLPLPDWLGEVQTEWSAPEARISLKDGALEGEIGAAAIVVRIGTTQLVAIENLRIKLAPGADKPIRISGVVMASAEIKDPPAVQLDHPDLGLRIAAKSEKLTLTAQAGTTGLAEFETSLMGVTVSVILDPGPKARTLTIAGDLILTLRNGEPQFKIDKLSVVVDGHEAALDSLIGRLGGLIRIAFSTEDIKPGSASAVLIRLASWIGDLLGRMARLIERGAEATGSALNALGRGAAQMLEEAIRTATDLSDEVSSRLGGRLALELRLDPAGWRPVQILLSRQVAAPEPGGTIRLGGRGLNLVLSADLNPGLMIDLRDDWIGLVLQGGAEKARFTLGSNLFLDRSGAPGAAIGGRPEDGQAGEDVLQLTGLLAKDRVLAPLVLHRGRIRFFQTIAEAKGEAITLIGGVTLRSPKSAGPLEPMTLGLSEEADLKLDVNLDEERLLALLPAGTGGGALSQSIGVTFGQPVLAGRTLKIKAKLTVAIGDFKTGGEVDLILDLDHMRLSMDGGDRIEIRRETALTAQLLGLDLTVREKQPDASSFVAFTLSWADGDMRLALGENARAELVHSGLSASGGLRFEITEFAMGRGGLDLTAAVDPSHPVVLEGVRRPFRFAEGRIKVASGRLLGGTIWGSGTLPPELLGEALAEISLTFADRGGRLALSSAHARLEKEDEPLFSTSTFLKTELRAIGLGYKEVRPGKAHFYFLLWGKIALQPPEGPLLSGLTRRISNVEIVFDEAPLTSDASELLRHIHFRAELDPPVEAGLFDVFDFEIRAISFHPASPAWPDHPPAFGLAGQIRFDGPGDAVSVQVDAHELLLAPPDRAKSALPRLRAEGLTVSISISGLARIEGSAIAVDGDLPLTVAPPAGQMRSMNGKGFLATARIGITGLGAYGATAGFLQLTPRDGGPRRRAMFIAGEAEQLSERIDTPIGPLWVRSAVVAMGKNYDLVALAAADQARTPSEMVRGLDGATIDPMNPWAWSPTERGETLTLALSATISLTSASVSSSWYDEENEKSLANPLLMNVMMAVRSDLTFFAAVRGWIATNYHDWVDSPTAAEWKSRPGLRGYLYFSVPRKELLARFIADPKGHIGSSPDLPEPIRQALSSTRYSATLYIRPGLFHFETGWPHELGFDLGRPEDNFHLSLSGGMVLRIEDATTLYGLAFRARGHIRFGVGVGSSRFGASVTALAEFALGGKFIAWLAPLNPRDTLFYGDVDLKITVVFSVSVWLSFRIFRKRITLRIGFSIRLTVEIAAELVVSGEGLGGRIHAAIGLRAFGRNIHVGLGFSFNNRLLDKARSRVARFLELGLGIEPPAEDALLAPAPAPEASRSARARIADARHAPDETKGRTKATPEEEDGTGEIAPEGRKIGATDFRAVLFDAGVVTLPGGSRIRGYLMQLVPGDDLEGQKRALSTFFCEPPPLRETGDGDDPDAAPVFQENPGAEYRIKWLEDSQPREDRPSVWRLTGNGFERPLIEAEDKTSIRLDHDLVIGEDEGGEISLGLLLADCFLGGTGSRPYTEPFAIRLQPEKSAHVRTRDESLRRQSSRTEMDDAAMRHSLLVEERRGSAIATIGDSLFVLAERARRLGPDMGWSRDDELQALGGGGKLLARDFGLTFLIPEEALDRLFTEEGEAGFALWKGCRTEKGWEHLECGVSLLARPEDSFSRREPRLAGARVEKGADGFKLLWDLEPAFGASGSAGSDPEAMLAHYQIERSFEGMERAHAAEFRTKSAAPVAFVKDGQDGILAERSGIRTHLCDDLSLGGLPPDLRALLLGTPIPSGRNPREVWRSHVLPGRRISVVYKVVAVDTMGGRSSLRVVEREIRPPVLRAEAPVSAKLTLLYKSQPTPARNGDPDIRLELEFADEAALEAARAPGAQLKLRLRAGALRGGGEYGVDAVDEFRAVPGQQEIDLKQVGRDSDVILIADPDGDFEADLGVSGRPAESVAFRLRLGKGESLRSGVAASLMSALGVLEGGFDPGKQRAVRVFAQRSDAPPDAGESADPPSAWIQATMATRIPGEAADAEAADETALMETFEHPVDLQFAAMDAGQISAGRAGRLEFLGPKAESTLDALLDSGDSVLQRELDPDRRTAIRLEINVNAARLVESAAGNAALAPLIGGFDIFELDPLRAEAAEADAGAVAEMARLRGRLRVQPRSLAGMTPDRVASFSNLDVRYPSHGRRAELAAAPWSAPLAERPAKPGWYGLADNLAMFPEPVLRRLLTPAPDETLISSLLEPGPATRITAVLKWSEGEQEIGVLSADQGGPISAPGLRSWMSKLGFENRELDQAYAEWRRQGALPSGLARFGARLTFIVEGEQKDAAAFDPIPISLATPVHPMLEEMIARLAYASYQEGAEGAEYRRYEVVREEIGATDPSGGHMGFLEAHAEAADPYGWAALRSMGLAVGFRVYDMEEGRFLTGGALLDLVRRALEAAKANYGCVDLGAPFVELVDIPESFMWISGFDGRNASSGADRERILNSGLSVLQVSLRPRALAEAGPGRVRYARIDPAILGREPPEGWRLDLALDHGVVSWGLNGRGTLELLKAAEGRAWPARLILPDGRKDEALSAGGEIRSSAHPSVDLADVFGAFPALDGGTLKLLEEKTGAFGRFLSWLPPAALSGAPDLRAEGLEPHLERFAAWGERFLRHGGGATRAQASPPVCFALASLTDEAEQIRTPDGQGIVSAFFIDDREMGREIAFAVRPHGRYARLAAAVRREDPRAVTLAGGLPEAWRSAFVTVRLARTRALLKPSILWVGATQPREGTLPSCDLLVAQPADQVVGDANLSNRSRLQSAWTGVELAAVFRGRWRARRLTGLDLTGFEQAGTIPDLLSPVQSLLTEEDLRRLGVDAPDSWRGALRYSFIGLPHFFDVQALVHHSAGAVVSDFVTAPLPESPGILRFPPFAKEDGDMEVRRLARPPRWSIQPTKEGAGIMFDIPLIRNMDTTPGPVLAAWTGDGAVIAPALLLPDERVSYRLSLLGPDGSLLTPEFDILPTTPPDDDDERPEPFTLLASGEFEPGEIEVEALGLGGGPLSAPDDFWFWRLRCRALLSRRRYPTLPLDSGDLVAWASRRLGSFRLTAYRGSEALTIDVERPDDEGATS
ncbi:hypothetical protein [Neomegalonema sp.]|uniref:hypothetical protein n=1 Tax=Neomegalonema sp. TaxID=2039713 RepID=UPI0026193F63|nr:hypothetical protein [Neomegalonema sp.]MDD2869769.1 hypothetical protein [Neomegalonema sp.]